MHPRFDFSSYSNGRFTFRYYNFTGVDQSSISDDDLTEIYGRSVYSFHRILTNTQLPETVKLKWLAQARGYNSKNYSRIKNLLHLSKIAYQPSPLFSKDCSNIRTALSRVTATYQAFCDDTPHPSSDPPSILVPATELPSNDTSSLTQMASLSTSAHLSVSSHRLRPICNSIENNIISSTDANPTTPRLDTNLQRGTSPLPATHPTSLHCKRVCTLLSTLGKSPSVDAAPLNNLSVTTPLISSHRRLTNRTRSVPKNASSNIAPSSVAVIDSGSGATTVPSSTFTSDNHRPTTLMILETASSQEVHSNLVNSSTI
jgi:hypothetical protein